MDTFVYWCPVCNGNPPLFPKFCPECYQHIKPIRVGDTITRERVNSNGKPVYDGEMLVLDCGKEKQRKPFVNLLSDSNMMRLLSKHWKMDFDPAFFEGMTSIDLYKLCDKAGISFAPRNEKLYCEKLIQTLESAGVHLKIKADTPSNPYLNGSSELGYDYHWDVVLYNDDIQCPVLISTRSVKPPHILNVIGAIIRAVNEKSYVPACVWDSSIDEATDLAEHYASDLRGLLGPHYEFFHKIYA